MEIPIDKSPTVLEQLPPDIDDSGWSRIRLKDMELINFGRFDHVKVDFSSLSPSINNGLEPLSCLVGPNGTGKTTILTAIQMLFSRYDGYDEKRYKANMLKYIRNFRCSKNIDEDDFCIKGTFQENSGREYIVEITRLNKVVSFHPDFISERLPHYCFFTRYDQELHTFQLKRSRWEKFKLLFESVTGYEIEEDDSLFDIGEDTRMRNLLHEYVMSFNIKKPEETISHKQCSAGERKLIKTFSTVLNKSVSPSIILIDNAVMHIEVDRHVAVIEAMKKCFDNNQLIVTCHSEPIKRAFSGKNLLIDMRFNNLSPLFVREPYRLRVFDELKDLKDKLQYSALSSKTSCKNVIREIDLLLDIILHKQILQQEQINSLFVPIATAAYEVISEDLVVPYKSAIMNLSTK